MRILPDLPAEAQRIAELAPAFIEGLLQHLTLPEDGCARSSGILLDGCMNKPKNYATRSELIWGTAYLLFSLYYLKTGTVVE